MEYDQVMTDAEKRELELLRELRHRCAAMFSLQEWWSRCDDATLNHVSKREWDAYQDLLQESYEATEKVWREE